MVGPAGPRRPARGAVELRVGPVVAGGSGLAELDGRKVFVPFAAPGEKVRARITTSKRDYAVARLDAVLEPSPARREPPCPLFGRCGGCRLQHLGYEEQLAVKRGIVADALRRIARLEAEVAPVIASPGEWHYRNKTQYAVGFFRGPRVGFYAEASHHIIVPDACLLHPPAFDAARRACADWLADEPDATYREDEHSGSIRHLVLRTDGTRTIALVATRTRDIAPGLVERLRAAPGISAVCQTRNPERTNRVLGPETRPVAGEPELEFRLAGRRLAVSPAAFFQVNTAQAGTLARLVRAGLAGPQPGHLLDLYSGVGAFALAAADLAGRVTGLELDPVAVADARRNAELNGLENVEFREADADRLAELPACDAVILDPPRKGASRELLAAIAAARPGRVIYVSCDPATLARDLALLVAAGYRLARVEPVDMFPQTAHVETVATLEG
ncbi:MAG: 23S rRNA (uracil(1939)-C(5))-methyltransferase RlmD [bacterium]